MIKHFCLCLWQLNSSGNKGRVFKTGHQLPRQRKQWAGPMDWLSIRLFFISLCCAGANEIHILASLLYRPNSILYFVILFRRPVCKLKLASFCRWQFLCYRTYSYTRSYCLCESWCGMKNGGISQESLAFPEHLCHSNTIKEQIWASLETVWGCHCLYRPHARAVCERCTSEAGTCQRIAAKV